MAVYVEALNPIKTISNKKEGMFVFRPKLFDTFKQYSRQQFLKDGIAGIVVGVVALPLAIAFAIASGVTPEKGLITAVIAGFLISAFGGSRVQIGGPTGAFVVIVYGIIQQYGFDGLLIATAMAGVILIIFGLAKLGSIIKFIPHSVIVGFTLGIAVLIFTGQINEFLGLGIRNLPADFLDKISRMFEHIAAINPYAVGIALGSIVIIVVMGKFAKGVPGSLVALILAAVMVYMFKWPVETIGSRFGAIPHTFPVPAFPHVDFKTFKHLLNPAFTIAMLGAIESLLSAVVADGMISGRSRSNTELIAQGIANVVSPLFGGIPATGAIARTATNVKSGGRTPVAGMIHALVLLAIMLFLGSWVTYIPMACLAGVLMVVAYHMSEWKSVVSIIRLSWSSALVMGVTFFLTLLVDLTVAIEIGLILSTFVFIRNISLHTNVSLIDATHDRDEEAEKGYHANERLRQTLPNDVMMYEINGPLFFGAVYKFKEAMHEISRAPKVMILKMDLVPIIDSTGMHALEEALHALGKSGTRFILCGLQPEIRRRMHRADLVKIIGVKNFCKTLPQGIERARELIQAE